MIDINRILIICLSLFIFIGCKHNTKTDTISKKSEMFEVGEADEVTAANTNYRIPSPIDLFLLLENSGTAFVEEALNSPLKRVQYSSTVSRAINFGVYTTDLAYCSVYGDFQGSLVYFNTAKDIAVDLGMYEGYGEEIAYRINNNLNNIDSLIDISTDSYFQATTFLSDQGMSDIMALIMTGCWIESIYIVVEAVHEFDATDPMVERIADQRYLLENLIELIKANHGSNNMDEVLQVLLEIQEVYDLLYFNDDNVIITKNQYVKVVNKIKEKRNQFVG